MAHDLGLKVTAEGVETIDQLHILGDMHCDNAQGYLFDRAVPAQEFLTILQNNGGTYQNIKTRLA
jgi:EAL domain-containing protein (putative c-di-GMP-specific phosphodiesterase class I)